jgi:hypothetical protein
MSSFPSAGIEALACPACGAPLDEQHTDEQISCGTCPETWPVDDHGVIRFAQDGEGLTAGDEGFLRRLERTPNGELSGSLADEYPDRYGRYVDPKQSDWWLLGTVPSGVVLDVSVAHGSLSRFVAEQAQSVIVVDTELCRLKATAVLADTFGIETVVPVQIPSDTLPLRAQTVDRAYLTGSCPAGPSERNSIRQVRECLVDGGELHVRIQNRYDIRGAVRFPRATVCKVLNTVVSATGASNRWHSGGSTSTHRAVGRQLTEAGFVNVDARYGVPDARQPQYLFSDESALARYLDGIANLRTIHRSLLSRSVFGAVVSAFTRSGLVGLTAPALFFEATWNDD